jgi:hypothetical protein
MRLLAHARSVRAAVLAPALATLPLACGDEPRGREETGLEALGLTAVSPRLIVPGTRMQLDGRSFLDQSLGVSWLRLEGTYAGLPIDAYLPADFIDFDRMDVVATPALLRLLGPPAGTFSGRVSLEVDFVPDDTRYASVPLALTFEVAEHLEPRLDEVVATPTIRVNEPIEVVGAGYLLGGDEGTTWAIVEGCFAAATGDGQCLPVAPVQVPVEPAAPFDREHGVFAFSPRIAGIEAGAFAGSVVLRNEHADGMVAESLARPVVYTLAETLVAQVGREGEAATLGYYVEVTGGGFVASGDGGGTVLRFTGEYQADDGDVLPLDLEVVPDFVDGRTVRYVINEDDALASAIDVRYAQGTFVGTVAPVVDFGGQTVVGQPTPTSLRLAPVRQVVYLQWNPSYVEALRLFGLRALDAQIRERVRQVLRRDYAGLNVDFRDEPPLDYALYSTLEIAGPDPNGLGLLGYDNTPGKDTNNERLNDQIGGVNAQTLGNGQPGYGGVFMESLFSFSLHPPVGTVVSAEVATVTFDQIFNPFRPDGGQPVTSAEIAGLVLPALGSGAFCPAGDRPTQIACAVFVLGSVVGSTTSHELGHSLGLADPWGDEFHDVGDLPNRLMDAGGARSFEERAELYGQGPARFCDLEYGYLRDILPSDEPAPELDRPPC